MIGIGLKNTIADVDVLGFDYAVIDEAHRCKNVFSQVKADDDGNKRYNIQSATSETGQKAFLILNFIQRKYGRNTMLLTATPFPIHHWRFTPCFHWLPMIPYAIMV